MIIPLLIGMLILPGISWGAWVSPTNYQDPDSDWSNEPNAYDDNTATYAENLGNIGWNGFLVLTSTTTGIRCGRIRVNADYWIHIDAVDIDVKINGVWTDVWQGTITNAGWDEKTFPVGTVTAARFRYNYNTGGYIYWLYEFDFYEEPPVINPPTCETQDASSVEETTAILHGRIINDGGEPCKFQFQYGTTSSYGTDTGWTGSKATGETFSRLITGLRPLTTYHFRAQGSNTAGIGSGLDKIFYTGSVSAGWVSPIRYSDPNAKWEDEINAYDDELSTYAKCYHNIGDPVWSPYLYLGRGTITSNKIRFFATTDGNYIDLINIDVFKNGAWTSVGTFTFLNKQWEEKSFATGTVSQARIRFRVTTTGVGIYWELYEFDFYKISTNTPTLSWTGELGYGTDGLEPETGYSNTNFVYRVEYTDLDGDGPSFIKVFVDKNGDGDYTDSGENINLSGVSSGDPSKYDGNYTNGEWFTTSINIPYGPNTDNCSYYFGASDGVSTATGTPTTPINAPDVFKALIDLLSPTSGPVGYKVIIEGNGYTPNSLIWIDFGTSYTIATTIASINGTFSTTFIVDTQPAGTRVVTVNQGYSRPTNSFIITSKITFVSPNSGLPGTVITILGTGFSDNSQVVIDFGTTKSIATRYTTNNGSFSSTFLVDTQLGGTMVLTAKDGLGNVATSCFFVLDIISLSISTSTFSFGLQSLDAWTEATQTTIITNNGNVDEDFFGQLGTFTTTTGNEWSISNTSNGPNTCMALWGTSTSGPWHYIGTYNTNWSPDIVTNLPPNGTITLYFNIKTPLSTSSYNEYKAFLVVTAGKSP